MPSRPAPQCSKHNRWGPRPVAPPRPPEFLPLGVGTGAGHIALPLVTDGAIRCPRGLKTITVLESKLSDGRRKQSSQRSDSRLKMLRAVGLRLPNRWIGWTRATTLPSARRRNKPLQLAASSASLVLACFRAKRLDLNFRLSGLQMRRDANNRKTGRRALAPVPTMRVGNAPARD